MKPNTPPATSVTRAGLPVFGLTFLLLISVVLSWSPMSLAQEEPQTPVQEASEPEGPDWFQVELIVFARPNGASHGEQWPRDLELRYPFNWVTLQDPEAPQSWLPDWLQQPGINPGLVGAPGLEEPSEPRWTPLQVDLERRPHFRLGAGDRNLNAVANALERNSQYRLLFHQAWRQPLEEDQSNPAILIDGGDRFGPHRELEGSVTLSLSRYLHLRTNLWLTEFEPNFGQPPQGWPELPLAPSRLASDRPAAPTQGAGPVPFSKAGEGGGSAWDRFTQASESLIPAQTLPGFLQEDYLPRRIVALKQQRRMRSEELHYLDHPLFGVIIEIKPYERPKSDAGDESVTQAQD